MELSLERPSKIAAPLERPFKVYKTLQIGRTSHARPPFREAEALQMELSPERSSKFAASCEPPFTLSNKHLCRCLQESPRFCKKHEASSLHYTDQLHWPCSRLQYMNNYNCSQLDTSSFSFEGCNTRSKCESPKHGSTSHFLPTCCFLH